MDRIQVVGTSGSGKSELARRLAARLGSPHVELDDLHWLPGWRERDREDFRERLREIVAGDRWVIAGNYQQRAQDLIWPRATAIVWLDYSFPVTFGRAFVRTLRRAMRGEECCNGNRESLRKAFFSRDSILLWVLKTHAKCRRDYAVRLSPDAGLGFAVHRFHRPRDADHWLASLTGPGCRA